MPQKALIGIISGVNSLLQLSLKGIVLGVATQLHSYGEIIEVGLKLFEVSSDEKVHDCETQISTAASAFL